MTDINARGRSKVAGSEVEGVVEGGGGGGGGWDLAKLQGFRGALDPWHCLELLSSFVGGGSDT